MENQKFYSILIQYIAPYNNIDIIVGTGNILRSIFSNVIQSEVCRPSIIKPVGCSPQCFHGDCTQRHAQLGQVKWQNEEVQEKPPHLAWKP